MRSLPRVSLTGQSERMRRPAPTAPGCLVYGFANVMAVVAVERWLGPWWALALLPILLALDALALGTWASLQDRRSED